MKAGDLVKLCRPTTRQVSKVFLVTEWRTNWLKVLGYDGWKPITDFEVVNESR